MKTSFGNTIKHQNLLIIILSLALIFTVAVAVSCQSQTPAPVPPVPGDSLPPAPATGEPEPPAGPAQIEVSIESSAFNPASLNIPVGTTIVWYNNDSDTHTVTARNNFFDSRNLAPGDTFEYTFPLPGAFEYYCAAHPSVIGKITIE
ncbi:cupredoxin domain-containing protein [Chloroflexota bacterium]